MICKQPEKHKSEYQYPSRPIAAEMVCSPGARLVSWAVQCWGLCMPCFGCWLHTRAPAVSERTSHQDPTLQRCHQYVSAGGPACVCTSQAICSRLTSSGFSKSLLPVISQHHLQNPNLCPPGWPLSLPYLSWTCSVWIHLQGFAFNIAGYYRLNFHHMALPSQLRLQEIAYRCRDLSLRLFPTSSWPQWIFLLTIFPFFSAAISCSADFHYFVFSPCTLAWLLQKNQMGTKVAQVRNIPLYDLCKSSLLMGFMW